MSYIINVKRTDFFNELTPELQKKYFNLTRDKFLPTIDNIYYSVFLDGDHNDNYKLKGFLRELEQLKNLLVTSHVPQDFSNGLLMTSKSYKLYKYCLSNNELYDIFILSYLPNVNTPRILVQIRSFGLWTYGEEKMLSDSYQHVTNIFEPLGCCLGSTRESRIDYCYHTNIIVNPEKVFSDRNLHNQVHTTMGKWGGMGNIEHEDGKCVFKKDYLSMGQRSSGNVFIRLYNKGLEVIEMGYKNFFFEVWFQKGLINFYDKFCFEYAFTQTQKDYDYVHKGKMYFYLEYGTDELVKKEFRIALENPETTIRQIKDLVKGVMPEITTIVNIEFETKRRFYYFSDDFIDIFKYIPRDIPEPLNRLFKIIDNRGVFLDYLTSTTLCFNKTNGTGYASWWERLRNTKLAGLNIEPKLLRDYSSELDEKQAKVRFINSVVTNSVYNDKLESDFIEDISDLISNLNDNHVHTLSVLGLDENEIDDYMNGALLNGYKTKKMSKEKKLRNRKKKST